MEPDISTPRGVLIRDLVLFQLKLVLDGVKDLVLVQLSLGAAILDLLIGGRRRGRIFYSVVRASERFDLWLNLHAPAKAAGEGRDGLLSATPHGADGIAAKVEDAVGLGVRFAHRRWSERRTAAAARGPGHPPAANRHPRDGGEEDSPLSCTPA